MWYVVFSRRRFVLRSAVDSEGPGPGPRPGPWAWPWARGQTWAHMEMLNYYYTDTQLLYIHIAYYTCISHIMPLYVIIYIYITYDTFKHIIYIDAENCICKSLQINVDRCKLMQIDANNCK